MAGSRPGVLGETGTRGNEGGVQRTGRSGQRWCQVEAAGALVVARASEVRLGAVDTDSYRRDVDELVIKLEALHQAVEETRTA